jgi:hypothetical protein
VNIVLQVLIHGVVTYHIYRRRVLCPMEALFNRVDVGQSTLTVPSTRYKIPFDACVRRRDMGSAFGFGEED